MSDHRCARSCGSGKSAYWRPTVFVFSAAAGLPRALPVVVPMRLCDDCRDTVSAGDLITAAGWILLEGFYQRAFDRPRSSVAWDFFEDDEPIPSEVTPVDR